MAIELRLPNIKGETPEAQLAQIKSYLYQMAEQLNWALNLKEGDSVVVQGPAKTKGDEALDTFNSVKSLIIKSADIVEAYEEQMSHTFDSRYAAQSEFGTFRETANAAITANATGIEQLYTNVQSIESNVEQLDDSVTAVEANIKTGVLAYDKDGVPIYGLEVGQRSSVGGVDTFRKYARFTSNRLSFYDQNDAEVAYISDYKLYITSAQITGSFVVGRYILDTSDGLAFKWV